MLKLYVNREFLNPRLSYSSLLFPFWGPILKTTTPFAARLFSKHNFDDRYYTMVDRVEEADFVLLPHNYWLLQQHDPQLLQTFMAQAGHYRKPILIDAYGDSEAPIPVDNACILRTSQYRSRLKDHEIIIPGYAEDLLEAHLHNRLIPRPKRSKPVVGFTGWADASEQRRLARCKDCLLSFLSRYEAKYGLLRRGVFIREEMITRLNRCHLVDTNFIVRQSHSGHVRLIQGSPEVLRSEFVKNMLESDYILCIKGNGNYSVRFYEALSLGRIPLFLDTDCPLPLEDRINYQEFCVFVNYQDRHKIGEILYDFHRGIDPDRFISMQHTARDVFESYLRIDSFTQYLVEKLKEHLDS